MFFQRLKVIFIKNMFFLIIQLIVVMSHYHVQADPLDCWAEDGSAQKCEPVLQNVALNRLVIASETCGVPDGPETYSKWQSTESGQHQVTETCDANGPNSHPVQYLTDINDRRNYTYWQSRAMSRPDQREVTLTISFEKEYEVSYVYLQFKSVRPKAMAIFKSQNNGRTWTPYQYFAQDCRLQFNTRAKTPEDRDSENEVLCSEKYSAVHPLTGGKVVFNPTNGGRSDLDNKFMRQEWVTVTDLKIKLIEMNNPMGDDVINSAKNLRRNWRRSTPRKVPRKDAVTMAPSSFYYAVNDLTVGARCKCNGHASTCSLKGNRLKCDCQHNTAGDNCEKCKPTFYDQPWGRATEDNPHPCVACKCNGHSSRCRYDPEKYMKSGRVSGTVCHKCRHHTTGDNCQYCKSGYFRSNRRNITHPKACRPCNCHLIGSVSPACNPVTGECLCKTGVTGRRCFRCRIGFRQTHSEMEPCVVDGMSTRPTSPSLTSASTCKEQCRKDMHHIDGTRFCSFDFVFVITVNKKSVQILPKWMTVSGDVEMVFKRGAHRIKKGALNIAVKRSQWTCLCPKMRLGRKYLVMGRYHPGTEKPSLVLAGNGFAVLTWQVDFKRKLRRLVKRMRKSSSGCK